MPHPSSTPDMYMGNFCNETPTTRNHWTFVIFDYTGTVTVYTEYNAEFKEAKSSKQKIS